MINHKGAKRQRKLRIAWFSILNTEERERSVSAYCTDRLLPFMKEDYEIELFHNSFDTYQDFPTFHYLSAFLRHREKPFDICFYQLEDLPEADFLRVQLALMPGIVWFHDFRFRTFGPEPILNSPWKHVVEQFNGVRNVWPERLIEQEQEGPAAHREAAFTVMPVFSSAAGSSDFINEIKMRISDSLPCCLNYPVDSFAGKATIKPSSMKIAFSGGTGTGSRVHNFFQALSSIENYSLKWLIDESEKGRAEELIEEFGLQRAELILGRSPDSWEKVVTESSIAVHTLFSAFDNPGPYLSISMRVGLAVIVTDFTSFDFLPDNLVYKIMPGDTESYQIRKVLEKLSEEDSFLLKEEVQAFAEENNDSWQVAGELRILFRRYLKESEQTLSRWQAFSLVAQRAVLADNGISKKAESADFLDDSQGYVQQQVVEPVFRELGWLEKA